MRPPKREGWQTKLALPLAFKWAYLPVLWPGPSHASCLGLAAGPKQDPWCVRRAPCPGLHLVAPNQTNANGDVMLGRRFKGFAEVFREPFPVLLADPVFP